MLRKLLGKILGKAKKVEAAATHSHGGISRAHGHGHSPSAKAAGPAHAPRPAKSEPGRSDKRGPSHDAARKTEHGSHARDHALGGGQGHGHGPAQSRTPGQGPAKHGQPRAQGEGAQSGHGRGEHSDRHRTGDAGSGAGAGAGEGERRRRSRGGRGRGRGREGDRGPERGYDRDPGRDQDRAPRPDSPPERIHHAAAPVEETETAAPAAPIASAPIEVPAVASDNEFSDLGLEPFIVAAIDVMGYKQPTPIQSEAIPLVLSGRDVIGSAQTGTGKTAAFGLPILQKLGAHGSLRCLILEPTRELAVQVDEAFHSFSKFTDLRTAVIFGGVGYGPQREALRRGLDIVVATPGRLLDLISQGDVSLKGISYLVLDEVDRMLDMGFLPDVKRIIEMCQKERQTLFFSATIPPELEGLTKWCLRDPHTIEIGRRRAAAETVSHAFYPVIESQKLALLHVLLDRTNYESVLIFCRTKHGADFVAGRLEKEGHKVAVMHSNRSQVERMDALKGFKSGKYELLVATDLAARGLDIAGITHVINYDTPQHAEDYVHRIGRTGRAEAEGDAFTLLTEDEMKHAFAIERFIGQKVERKKLDDFPYQYSAIFESAEGAPKNAFRSRLYRGTRK